MEPKRPFLEVNGRIDLAPMYYLGDEYVELENQLPFKQ
jgi:hypothetical protein